MGRILSIFYSYKYSSSLPLKKIYVIFDSQNLITNRIEPINEPMSDSWIKDVYRLSNSIH